MNKQIISEFKAEVRNQLRKAFEQYGITEVDDRDVTVRADIRGMCAGRGGYKVNFGRREYYLNFNAEAVEKHWDEMVKDTIPHEIAHVICYIRPELGKNHDRGWKRVCRSLGGDDSRTHDMLLTPAKRKFRHEYNVNGASVMVGPKHHAAIQRGRPVTVRATGEQILRSMYVRKVQVGGPVQQPEPPRQAAQNPSPSRTTKKPSSGSKMDVARKIMVENPGKSRSEIIALFMEQAGLTKAGASTYYQKLK